MGLFSLITSIIMALLALWIIIYVLKAVLSPFLGNFKISFKSGALRKKQKLLENADKEIEAGNIQEGVKSLLKSFYLDIVKNDLNLLSQIASHHAALLSRLLIIADRQALTFDNLPIIEDLLNSRIQILKAYIEVGTSGTRTKDGKALPNWAKGEFKKKIADIEDRLETNRKNLIRQFDIVYDVVRSNLKTEEVIYH